MGRAHFDNLVKELSELLGGDLPRYALWLHLREAGLDPEQLTREQAIALCGGFLQRFLRERGVHLAVSEMRHLRRVVARFEPSLATPAPGIPALK